MIGGKLPVSRPSTGTSTSPSPVIKTRYPYLNPGWSAFIGAGTAMPELMGRYPFPRQHRAGIVKLIRALRMVSGILCISLRKGFREVWGLELMFWPLVIIRTMRICFLAIPR